jgi:hypothetical protein
MAAEALIPPDVGSGDDTPAGDATTTQQAGSRPEWVPQKFWDQEKGEARFEELAKSYTNLEGVFGKRIHELSEPNRRALVDAVPEAVREEWAKAERERLAADEEFLAPILEARKPQAPETYEFDRAKLPEQLEIADDDPLLMAVGGWAKQAGLSQEQFNGLIAAYGEVVKAQLEAQPSVEELRRQIGPDFERRSKALAMRVVGIAGKAEAEELLAAIQTPAQFVALEKLMRAGQDPSLPSGVTAAVKTRTLDDLKAMMQDPRYWDPVRQDKSFIADVESGFAALYGNDERV